MNFLFLNCLFCDSDAPLSCHFPTFAVSDNPGVEQTSSGAEGQQRGHPEPLPSAQPAALPTSQQSSWSV